jgi:hypothetical protein
VSANGTHQSGLHSLLADRLGGAHLLADLETAEPPTDTLLREADGGNEAWLRSGSGAESAVAFRAISPSIEHARLILQLTARRIKRIPDRNVGILVPPGLGRVARDVNALAARHLDMDAHAIRITLVVAMLGTGYHHAGRRDAIIEALELPRFLANRCFERIGMVDVLEDDLKGHLHHPDLVSCFRD